MDDQWEIMNKRLQEIEEETRKKVERLNQELAEKDSIIQQLTANIEELTTGQTPPAPIPSESSNLINEYQAKIASFDQEREKYEAEISKLNEKLGAMEQPAQDSSGAADEINALKEQVGALEELVRQLKIEKSSLETELRELKEKGPDLAETPAISSAKPEYAEILSENEKLKKDLEEINKELDEIMESNRDQSQKIEELEALLVSVSSKESISPAPEEPLPTTQPIPQPKPATRPPLAPAPSKKVSARTSPVPKATPISATHTTALTTIIYFSYSNGAFIHADIKPEGIILECNIKEKLWILTIEPTTSFLDKNKALRIVRSLPATGFKIGNEKVGVGFELKIYGEF